MDVSDLPYGEKPEALTFPWFPTPFQAVIFRNWEMVPVERLAEVLRCTEKDVLHAAKEMGLAVPPRVSPLWLERGYVSIIRSNWHLLDYPQLLQLLHWNAERLNNTLQNEDFLWVKLGWLKPDCGEVCFRPLSAEERRCTAEIKRIMEGIAVSDVQEAPFGFLEHYANANRRLCFPARQSPFDLKMAYSYSAPYGDALLMPELAPYPDDLLKCLAARGVNAIWLPVVLYQVFPWDEAPELSAEGDVRIRELNKLIARAKKYGMKVIVYLNEPRGVPYNLFKDREDILRKYLGFDVKREKITFCISKPATKKLLFDSVEYLFRQAPGLGGVFTISMSENPTHCHSHQLGAQCPLCSKRPVAEVISEVNTIIADAVHRVNPDARVMCWNWGWKVEEHRPVLARLPQNVAAMAVSEKGRPFMVGKTRNAVEDYSLSHAGPSPQSLAFWNTARLLGHECVAKVQLSNTWEGSSVPYIPVTRLVARQLARLRRAGVRDLMLSWTLGGYPSINMDLLNMTHAEMVRRNFGKQAAVQVGKALDAFSTAFECFPFDVCVVYCAPHNIGPANLFYPEPTGYTATMVGFPYDDLEHWRGIFPLRTYLHAMRELCRGWRRGVKILEQAGALIRPRFRLAYEDLLRVSEMCYLLYSGTVRQIRYVQLRGRKKSIREMMSLLRAEEAATRRMLRLASEDSRFGFEATNHYAYTLNELREKMLNLNYLSRYLPQREDGGITRKHEKNTCSCR